MADYLEDLIKRSWGYQDPVTGADLSVNAGDPDVTVPGARPGSLLDRLTRKKPIDMSQQPTGAQAPWQDPTQPASTAFSSQQATPSPASPPTNGSPLSPYQKAENFLHSVHTAISPTTNNVVAAATDPLVSNPLYPMLMQAAQGDILTKHVIGGGGTKPPDVSPEQTPQPVSPVQAQQPVPFQKAGLLPDPIKLADPLPAPREVDGGPRIIDQPVGNAPAPPAPPQPQIPDRIRQMQMNTDLDGAGILGGFGDWLREHSNQLLAIGAGLAGAPSLHAGIGRAAAYSIPAIQQDIAMQQQRGGMQASYNALFSSLTNGGMDREQAHNLAMAGATNPKLFDSLMTQYAAPTKWDYKEVKVPGLLGEKTRIMAVDPRDPTNAIWTDTGQPVNARGGRPAGPAPQAGGGSAAAPPQPTNPFGLKVGETSTPAQVPAVGSGGVAPAVGGGGMAAAPQQGDEGATIDEDAANLFAPGVTSYKEQGLSPEDYIAQFTPSVQQQIKDRINGQLPISATGARGANAAQNAFLQRAAEFYGASIGMPMDQASVIQRRNWAASLADTKGGIGMQAKGFQQGLEHLANASDKWVKLNQWGGMGIEPIARAENRTITSQRQELVNGIKSDSQKLGGEMAKLFSSGGAKSERQETAESVGDTRMSKIAAAGSLKAARDQMFGGLRPLERRRDELFPQGNAPRGSQFVGPAEQALIDRINRNIALLDPGSEEAKQGLGRAAAPPPVQFKPGQRYTVDAQGNVVNQ